MFEIKVKVLLKEYKRMKNKVFPGEEYIDKKNNDTIIVLEVFLTKFEVFIKARSSNILEFCIPEEYFLRLFEK